jgi:cytochrome c5
MECEFVKFRNLWVSLGVALSLLAAFAWSDVPPGTPDEIAERVRPLGELCRAGDPCAQGTTATASASTGPMTGEQVYSQFCFACHATGAAGAPKLGDTAAWAPRMEQGMDTLFQHTLSGIRAMPPKGTCNACSDDELRGALQHMVDAAQ